MVERMNLYDLELSFQMLLLEYNMSVSATKIAAIYRGIMVRSKLRTLIINRKRATLFI